MDTIELLKSILMTQSINTYKMEDLRSGKVKFDDGIRKQLFKEYDYSNLAEEIEKKYRENTVSIIIDQFGVRYILFSVPGEGSETRDKIVIGPYQTQEQKELDAVMQRLKIPLISHTTLQHYYYGVTLSENIEAVVQLFMDNLYEKNRYEIIHTRLDDQKIFQEELQMEQVDELHISLLEKHYAQEEKLLKAIREGDTAKAYYYMSTFGQYQPPERISDALQNARNPCLVLNTLFRKAVQQAQVHPVHIDDVSSMFAKRIGNARNSYELSNICTEMIRKYCMLVQNYSLEQYSETVGKVMNYIDLHLQEPLGLQVIANQFNINASYLSRLIKKELGKSLTEYVNEKRMEKAMVYLAVTNLPIQEVAARIGILDENYFSRIFKKAKNMTPKEYRNAMKK